MGLISTVADLGKSVINADTTLTDIYNNAKKWIFGEQPTPTVAGKPNKQATKMDESKFQDLRGRASVYRNTKSTYNSQKQSFQNTYEMTKDFCWYDSGFLGKNYAQFEPKIQKIILHEFQPYQQSFLGQLAHLVTQLKSKDKSTLANEMKNSSVGLLFSQATKDAALLGEASVALKNIAIAQFSKDPSALYDDKTNLALKNPWEAIQRMFLDGIWLHSYIIPLLDKDLQFINSGGMKYSNVTGGGGQLGAVLKLAAGKKGVEGMDKLSNMWGTIPSTPNFTPSLESRSDINTTFYLINKNSEYTVRNYRFLQVFSAGAMQVQLPWGAMQSPNIYYVEIPGKRQMVWAQISVAAKEVGKYRIDQYASGQIYQQTNSKIFTPRLDNTKAESTQVENLKNVLWPEAWEITVKITDFTPNTFNAYQHYLTHGSCLSQLVSRKNSDQLITTMEEYQQKITNNGGSSGVDSLNAK